MVSRSSSFDLDRDKLSIAFTNRDLCTRSATCVGICPERAIDLDDAGYPVIPDPAACTECGACAQACPGGQVDFAELAGVSLGAAADLDEFDGHTQQTVVATATDPEIASGGSGGGVATALAWHLIESGEVDGCIVTRPCPDRPWRGEPIIARSHLELLSSQGSKYAVVPVNKIFREVLEQPGRYAFVALPCQAHGFWKATQILPGLREKISVVIGLFCGGAMEPYLIPEMLRMNGIREGQVADIEYRGGQWPGRMRATLTDGSERNLHYSNYKDGAYNYLVGMYLPPRCATCIDGSCEFSDLSVSDAWTRDSAGEFKFKAHSRILVRTDRGSAVVEGATRRGVISALDVSDDENYRTHRLQTRRKGVIARVRVERMKSRHVPVPSYDRVAPEATRREKSTELLLSGLLRMCRHRWFRYPLAKLLLSRVAVPLIQLRLMIKRRAYRRGA